MRLVSLVRLSETSEVEGEADLMGGSAAEAIGLVVVETQHLDGSLDAEVVEDAAHLQGEEVVLRRH